MQTDQAMPMPAVEANPYRAAQRQFDEAAELIDLSDRVRAILRVPRRELLVNFPVEMDDGGTRMFQGYRVQHNITRGPAKGAFVTTRRRTWTRCGRWRCG